MPSAPDYPYELVSRWSVPGRVEEVYAVLTDSAGLARWWPEAYHRVREIAPGDRDGRGRLAEIVTRGKLPYELHWRLEVTEAVRPERIGIRATGDVAGLGEWRLTQTGSETELTYTWRVRVEKAWMRLLEPVLRPLFRMNHDWVMRRGEAGLRQELARRATGGPGS